MEESIKAVVTAEDEVVPVDDSKVCKVYDKNEYEARRKFGVKHFELEKQDRQDFKSAVADGGNYVWNYFIPQEKNFVDIINSTVTRLVYLATYMNKDNYIAYDNGRIMSRQQIQKLLKLNDRTFIRFLKDAKINNYLLEDEIGFKLLNTKFGRGTMDKAKKQLAAKLFIYSVRFLYENATVSSHKTLAYLYMIIPYINLKYNVLCENPFETDKTKVKKVTVTALCEKLGLDVTHSTRFVNQLLKIQYPDIEGDRRSILISVKDSKNDELREFLCVNPRLYSVYANKEKIIEITGLSDAFLIEEGEIK